MQALSAYQAGLLLILSFPYLPDMIALVRELASSHNAPSSEELLTKGAMRYAEKQGAADIQVLLCPLLPWQILTSTIAALYILYLVSFACERCKDV